MNVNISETKKYYHSITEASLCDCGYCQSYRLQVRFEYPKVASYLETFGIDITKPYETSAMEPDDKGILEFGCCQYVVFGNCAMDYHYKIDEVEFKIATSYSGTGIKQEHFVIELFPIKLKLLK